MEPARPGGLIARRYRLDTVIGRGGMGVVWQARDELLSRDVAVKELIWPAYFSEAEQQAACRRATREAQMAARLNHRNVIKVLDIVEDRECPWIVMEFLRCQSLRDLIAEEGPLCPAATAEIGLEILAALRAAHAEGIVHRDVKPANILMAQDRVVLSDFGIARAAGSTTLTSVGVLIGSPSYIAPERARGGPSEPPGDLWGLGASLYATVEGRGPFDRDAGALASLTAAVADDLEPAPHAGPLWPVISGLLRKDPGERLDAAQAERMLRAIATAAGDQGTTATIPPQRSRVLPTTLVGLAALAVLAASSTAAALVSTSPSPRIMAPTAAITPSAAVEVPAPVASSRPPTTPAHSRAPAGTSPTARASATPGVPRYRAHPSRSPSESTLTTTSTEAENAGIRAAGQPPHPAVSFPCATRRAGAETGGCSRAD